MITLYGTTVSIDEMTVVLDWMGIIVFATTGALVASRKEMDVVGFALLATVTGVGGGTLRDLLLGLTPVFWVANPTYLIVCLCVACFLFFTAHIPASRLRLLLWLDGIGLAIFAVTGAERALAADVAPVVAVAMGTITATFGGIIRDILGGRNTHHTQSRGLRYSSSLSGRHVRWIHSLRSCTRNCHRERVCCRSRNT